MDQTWKIRLLVLLVTAASCAFTAYGVDEDFEPPVTDWYTTDTHPWVLTTEQAHSGSYSARSDHWDDSVIWINTYIYEGTLSFWAYVDGYNAIACEYGYTEIWDDGTVFTLSQTHNFYPGQSGWDYYTVQVDEPGFINRNGFFKWHTAHGGEYTTYGPWFYLDDVTFPGASSDPALSKNVDNLDFGTIVTSKTFDVWNSGGGTLNYTISDNRTWISVSPTSGSSTTGANTITVTVNRSGLSTGHYTGTVTINPNYGSDQTVSISMDVPCPPPNNDDFADAQTISGNYGTVAGSNACATKETGEPNHAGNGGGASVWYKWAASFSGRVVISTGGSNFDTLLAVYTGSSVGSLSTIASNDDGGPGTTSQVSFTTSAGTTYKIAVDGYSGHQGNLVLSWSPDTGAVFRVEHAGNVFADGPFYGTHFYSGSADVAEWVPVSEPVEAGDVLELDPGNPGHYRKARGTCSNLVAGVVSTDPGFVLGANPSTLDSGLWTDPDSALLALVGIVPVKVTDEGGPIERGDLLVCSSIGAAVGKLDHLKC